jgi:hypothetical protein
MKNITVQRVLKVSVRLSANEWQLYNPESVGAGAVAYELNRAIMQSVNLGDDRPLAERSLLQIMRQRAEYGAADIEPLGVLREIMDQIYGAAE